MEILSKRLFANENIGPGALGESYQEAYGRLDGFSVSVILSNIQI